MLRTCLFVVLMMTSGFATGALRAEAAENTCTYTTWSWNSAVQRAEELQEIVTDRHTLSPEEQHPDLPCSVCREDQTLIEVTGVPPFLVCRHVAAYIERALSQAVAAGFPIDKVVGYRVGRTKGPLDDDGRRTRYSLHSFGLAVDINPDRNGLYDRCETLSPSCRLIRGGEWRPDMPGAVTPGTAVYQELIAIGWQWGGELPGRQKDLMHFSPSGD